MSLTLTCDYFSLYLNRFRNSTGYYRQAGEFEVPVLTEQQASWWVFARCADIPNCVLTVCVVVVVQVPYLCPSTIVGPSSASTAIC